MQEPQKKKKPPHGVFAELGLTIEIDGDDLVGQAQIVPNMCVPGTDALRLSVMAIWADTLIGLIAMKTIAPRIPVTLDLDVHVFEPIWQGGAVCSRARLTKAGKSVMVFTIDFTDEAGRPLGFGQSSFMAAPDPNLTTPPGDWAIKRFAENHAELLQPLAERVRCERVGPGLATLPWASDTQNSARAINGGVLAVAIEEAALSAVSPQQTLSSLTVRYLRSVRTGPALARAHVNAGLGQVEVRDASNDAVAIVATVRLFED